MIDTFCDHLRIAGRLKRTIDDRRWLLCKADRDLPYGLDQASDDEIVAWLYRDDLSRNSKAVYYDGLNSFYEYWTGRPGGVPYNPMRDMPRPRERRGRPRPITDDQLGHILTRAREPYRLWALIAAYEGARCVEISRLRRDDVTPELTYLHGKGDKEGVVPTHPDVYAAVQQLPPGPLARTARGRHASPRHISTVAGEYFQNDLGLPGVTMHRLRHWYGTNIRRRSDLRTAQDALRHEDPKTTAIYTEVGMDEIRAAVAALPRFSRGAAAEAAAFPDAPAVRLPPPPTAAPDPPADQSGRRSR